VVRFLKIFNTHAKTQRRKGRKVLISKIMMIKGERLIMQTIKLESYIGNDGMLHIPLPEIKDANVEVIIVYQQIQKPEKRQWSSEFLSTFGAWEGEALERAPQEEQSERQPFL
jgi:hypothetical protein